MKAYELDVCELVVRVRAVVRDRVLDWRGDRDRALAHAAGVSPATISAIRVHSKVPTDTWPQIASAMGIGPAELFEATGSERYAVEDFSRSRVSYVANDLANEIGRPVSRAVRTAVIRRLQMGASNQTDRWIRAELEKLIKLQDEHDLYDWMAF